MVVSQAHVLSTSPIFPHRSNAIDVWILCPKRYKTLSPSRNSIWAKLQCIVSGNKVTFDLQWQNQIRKSMSGCEASINRTGVYSQKSVWSCQGYFIFLTCMYMFSLLFPSYHLEMIDKSKSVVLSSILQSWASNIWFFSVFKKDMECWEALRTLRWSPLWIWSTSPDRDETKTRCSLNQRA